MHGLYSKRAEEARIKAELQGRSFRGSSLPKTRVRGRVSSSISPDGSASGCSIRKTVEP